MLRSWKIGRAFGVNIYLHWTFVILPILFIYQSKAFTLGTAALALITVAILAFFVILHEFGHILAARTFGIGTRDVILTPLGGMARLERMSEKPSEEILISLAGPAVNIVAAAGLEIATLLLMGHLSPSESLQTENHTITNVGDLVFIIISLNIGMAMFNLLPAFPMDGGRIFRGILASMTNRVTATAIAVWVGTFVISGFGLLAFIGGNLLALPLALFIVFIGHMELRMVKRIDAARRQYTCEQSIDDEPDDVMPGLPPLAGFSGYTWNADSATWIEWHNGNPVRACRMRAG